MQKFSLLLLTLAPVWALAQTQTPIEAPRRQLPPAAPAAPAAPAPASTEAAPAAPKVVLPNSGTPAAPAAGTPTAPKPSIASGLSPQEMQERMKKVSELQAKAKAAQAAAAAAMPAPAAGTPASNPAQPTPVNAAPATAPGANPVAPVAANPANTPANANPAAKPGAGGADSYVEFFDDPTVTLDLVVEKYEELTGKTVIRASTLFGGGGGGGGAPAPGVPGAGGGGAGGGGGGSGAMIPVVINPNQQYSTDEWLEFLRATLMVNGYSLHEYDAKLDILTFNGQPSPFFTSAPPKEGHRVYLREGDLPNSDQFVNFFLKVEHITPQDMVTLLGQPAHTSGKITAVPNANGLLITESVPVVKSYIEIAKQVDVANSIETINRFVQLYIADAEEIAQIITQMLQQQAQQKAGANGQTAPTRLVNAGNAAQQMTNALQGNQVPQAPGAPAAAAGQAAPDPNNVFVQADRRTHRILLSGPRKDVEYLEKLIKDFDKPSELKDFFSYKLRYMKVNEFLGIAQTTLESAGYGTASGGSAGGAGGAGAAGRSSTSGSSSSRGGSSDQFSSGGISGRSSTSSSSRSGSSGSSAFGGGGSFGGSSGFGGGATGGGGRSGGSGGGLGAEILPEALSVGKILLVSSPQNNTVVVSGPPDALAKMKDLIDQIDVRPMQVHIDCVIAEITMSDDLSWGLDVLRKLDSGSIGGTSVDFGSVLRNTGNTGVIDPISLTTNTAFDSVASASGLNTYLQVGELVSAYVRANESTSRVRVLQKPSIAGANLKTSSIRIGREVPYSSGTNTGNQTGSFNSYTDFKEVLLSLEVTPLINSKNEVTLHIVQTNDNVIGSTNIGGTNNPVPILGRQDLDTELTVPNQGIAVIGGLVADSRDTNNNGTPLLARIPVIKHIFGSTTKKDSRRELIIFIQPRIMETGDEMLAVNNAEVQRTIIGKEAEAFARPGFEMDGVQVPTEKGDIPFDQQGHAPEAKKSIWKRIFGKDVPPAPPAPFTKEARDANKAAAAAEPVAKQVADPQYPRK